MSGRVFSYNVCAATENGVQRALGSSGLMSKVPFVQTVAIADALLGVAQIFRAISIEFRSISED
jgi:hypothetical protein